MHQFNEHHPELKGFTAFYDREILPGLQQTEGNRLSALKKVKKICVGIAALTAFGLGLAYYYKTEFPVYFLIAAIGLGLGAIIADYKMKTVKAETKTNIVGGICRFLGWSFTEKLEDSPHIEIYKELGLVTRSYDRSSFEDRMKGTAHGAAFEFYEAHLEKRVKTKNGHTWQTRFRGQLLVLDFNRKFLGRTVVLRDKGFFNAKKKDDMKRVGLVDPVFEKIFEAYGTDQVEARYLLTPTFMQRLVDLENLVDGTNIRFGFIGGQLLIAVETSNRYEVGSMFKPLIETGRTQKILDEVGAIYDVIDGVMKPQR